jgi:coproporphyrinogen III oxidase-like Fe-S oxidoreductase
MGEALDRGELEEMDEELQRVMYHTVCETLTSAGFEWYEVSNFALPGHRSRQNMVYWTGQQYLGLGPAACSYIDGERRTNAPDIDAYCEAIEAGSPPPAESERIEGPMQLAEALMLGLRLREGVSMAELHSRTGLHVQQTVPRSLAHHLATGQLLAEGDRLTIPAGQVFTMNNTLADFIAEASES